MLGIIGEITARGGNDTTGKLGEDVVVAEEDLAGSIAAELGTAVLVDGVDHGADGKLDVDGHRSQGPAGGALIGGRVHSHLHIGIVAPGGLDLLDGGGSLKNVRAGSIVGASVPPNERKVKLQNIANVSQKTEREQTDKQRLS